MVAPLAISRAPLFSVILIDWFPGRRVKEQHLIAVAVPFAVPRSAEVEHLSDRVCQCFSVKIRSILIKAAAWNRPIHLQHAVLAAQIFGFGITSTPVTMILPIEADYFAIRPVAWLVRFSATGGGVVDRKQSPLR